MPKMNGKKIPYPDAEKRMGGGGLKMVKNKQGDKVPFYAADGKGKMMGGGKVMYRGGGSLSYGKMKMGGGGVAEDIAAAGIGGALGGAAGAAAGIGEDKRDTIQLQTAPSERVNRREKEEQEEYRRRLKEVNKAATTGAAAGAAAGGAAAAVKSKEKKGMGGSIARGSGAARAQQFRKNG